MTRLATGLRVPRHTLQYIAYCQLSWLGLYMVYRIAVLVLMKQIFHSRPPVTHCVATRSHTLAERVWSLEDCQPSALSEIVALGKLQLSIGLQQRIQISLAN